MLESEDEISGGTFLFSLTYCSNCASDRTRQHLHLALVPQHGEQLDVRREVRVLDR